VDSLAKAWFRRLRPRSLWRSTGSITPEEVRRTERWLATARLFLATSALVALWVDPREVLSTWVYALLWFYIGQGFAIILLLRYSRQQSTPSFLMLVHAADVVWPALICLLTTSQSNTFFLFFLFVLAAAAYRCGLWETVMTSVLALSLLWLESLALRLGAIHSINLWLAHHHLPLLNADVIDFEPKRLFMRSVYLVVMGLLLGYLAEQQKKLRAEKDEAARMLGMVSMEAGLAGTLSDIVAEMLRLYQSPRALIASREGGTGRISVGAVQLKRGLAVLNWLEPGTTGLDTYLGDTSALSCYAQSEASAGRQKFPALGLHADGSLHENEDDSFLRQFAEVHPFHRLLAISFSLGPELSGRIFILEPHLTSSVAEELRFLKDLVKQVGPAVYNVYLLRRLRKRAGALERARLVRDLHDGAVQSLIGVEMQMDVLRRSHSITPAVGDELERIQMLLREEVAKLRELMHQMKSVDIDGHKLPGFLRDTVQRFQRETGINARFLMDDEEVLLPQPVCRELARITQEALVNVRKHSGANQVLVHLLHTNGNWELVVEDDGSGFSFEGRVSQSELDLSSRAPAVIRERVRMIQGELTIESKPGRGARLEVRVAQPQPASHG
jgi:signal transduction histidine kinase